MTTRSSSSVSALQAIVLATLDSFKAEHVTVLDVHSLTTITDTMIIATGNSNRHARALAENVVKKAKEEGYRPLGIEGTKEAEWILIDLGDVVVHIMLAKTREFYNLEKLWQVPKDTLKNSFPENPLNPFKASA